VTARERERIKPLLDEYLRLYHSNRNKKLRSYWKEKPTGFAVNLFRPDEAKAYRETGTIPIVVNPCESIFAYLYGYSLRDYYTNPAVYSEMYLRQRIDQFASIGDDACLRAEIPIWLGSYYEHSLFGVKSTYSDEETPRAVFRVLLAHRRDLDRYRQIDFTNSGQIPLAIRFFEEISDLVEGTDLKVTMPYFNRGPFGILTTIMGFDGVVYKAYDDPEFVMDAMSIVSQVSIDYEKWIHTQFGCPLGAKAIYDDDVSCPIVSPEFYERFILPGEKQLETAYGRFSYWHSCGNCDSLLPLLKQLKIESINVSMIGDIDKYTRTFGNDSAYEICVHPVKDVLRATSVGMSLKLDSIISICSANRISAYSIMASALEGTGRKNIIGDLSHLFEWLEVARSKVRNFIAGKERERGGSIG